MTVAPWCSEMAVETVRVEGLAGVLRTLEQLPPEIVSKAGGPVKFALRKAGLMIRDRARANVDAIVAEPNIGGRPSKSTGALKESIVYKRRRIKGQNGEAAWVGIVPLKKQYANTRANRRKDRVGKSYVVLPPTYYGWFLEFGTERQTAKPFMRPAFESGRNEALQIFEDELKRRIGLIQRKLAKQNRVAS